MNDRVSAVPPAEFLLGPDAMDSDDYEKKFALDWKPPDLDPESAYNNSNNASNGGNRNSFVSTRSGGIASSSLTRIGTGASGSVWSKAPKQHGSSSTMASSVVGGGGAPAGGGFLARVGGRFGLTRSKSSFDVYDVEEENDSNGGGVLGSFIPPVFKHKRSESVNSGAMATAGFFKREAPNDPEAASKKSSTKGAAAPRPFSTSPAGAVAGVSTTGAGPGPILPGFDPTRRPTRDEITANYQSLLASGFFGTHAIQSTRFTAPGQRVQPPQAAKEEDAEPVVQDDGSHHPPSPERQPPPPPPSRLAPPPPPPPSSSMAMDTDSPSSEAIPVSPTILFHPTLSQQRPSSESMPPPPTVRPQIKPKNKPDHKANLSFSAVPYSSTRPGIEPSIVDRPFRPPPISLARFSMESSGRQSYDLQQQQSPLPRPLRGIKRPFNAASNASQASISTMGTTDGGPKGSMDYHRGSGQYISYHYGNGNAFTSGIADEDKPESGARKLVKKLRKSASRISIDLGNKTRQISISRMAPPPDDRGDDDDDKMMGMGDDCQGNNNHTAITTTTTTAPASATTTNLAPSARTSMSSTVRRSFSWKFGKLGSGNKDHAATTTAGGDSNRGGGGFPLNNHNDAPAGFVLNNTGSTRTTTFAPHAPVAFPQQQQATTTKTTPPANPFSNFSFLTTGGSNHDVTDGGQQQESHLKKREIRGRRIRKPGSPLKQSPSPMLPQPPSPTKDATPTMDWNHNQTQQQGPLGSPTKIRKLNRSRSRSRSNVIRVLHDPHRNSSSRPGAEHGFTPTDGGMPATMTTSAAHSVFCSNTSKPPCRDNADQAMEGVEFSFHFPGRMRPNTSASTSNAEGGGMGGPLAVVPDTNRGLMMMTSGIGEGAEATSTTTVKDMMMPHYSGRWVNEEDQEDMIF